MRHLLTIALALTLLAGLGTAAMSQDHQARPALDSLVEAERAFSRTCVAKGLRASFMEFFAADGIRFLPHPVNAQENLRQQPAPSGSQTFTLSWQPVFADVSQAGDLGFTTGPYALTDNARKNAPRYGYYFSIWRKQQDGSWRVFLDYGTDTPNSDNRRQFKSASSTGWQGQAAAAGLDDSTVLANLDRQISTLAADQGISATYRDFLISDARLHRAGLLPLVETSTILAFLDQQQWTKVTFEPIAAGMAQSADLGYSYGTYSLRRKDAAGVFEKGYYARVWKRDGKGNWKIAMDVANALPPEPASKP